MLQAPGTTWHFNIFTSPSRWDTDVQGGLHVQVRFRPPVRSDIEKANFPAWYNRNWTETDLTDEQIERIIEAVGNAVQPILAEIQGRPTTPHQHGAGNGEKHGG